jgi:hypothetical protein
MLLLAKFLPQQPQSGQDDNLLESEVVISDTTTLADSSASNLQGHETTSTSVEVDDYQQEAVFAKSNITEAKNKEELTEPPAEVPGDGTVLGGSSNAIELPETTTIPRSPPALAEVISSERSAGSTASLNGQAIQQNLSSSTQPHQEVGVASQLGGQLAFLSDTPGGLVHQEMRLPPKEATNRDTAPARSLAPQDRVKVVASSPSQSLKEIGSPGMSEKEIQDWDRAKEAVKRYSGKRYPSVAYLRKTLPEEEADHLSFVMGSLMHWPSDEEHPIDSDADIWLSPNAKHVDFVVSFRLHNLRPSPAKSMTASEITQLLMATARKSRLPHQISVALVEAVLDHTGCKRSDTGGWKVDATLYPSIRASMACGIR